MKRINSILLLFVIAIGTMGITACGDNDDDDNVALKFTIGEKVTEYHDHDLKIWDRLGKLGNIQQL
jgi:hypothetical protein